MSKLRIPPPDLDLVADLVNDLDPSLGDGDNLSCRAMPRHLRLYVAGWMLSDDTAAGDKAALRKAFWLYSGCGQQLLDQPRLLTTADIVAEVLQLTAAAGAAAAQSQSAPAEERDSPVSPGSLDRGAPPLHARARATRRGNQVAGPEKEASS